jgi:hypothetical protein
VIRVTLEHESRPEKASLCRAEIKTVYPNTNTTSKEIYCTPQKNIYTITYNTKTNGQRKSEVQSFNDQDCTQLQKAVIVLPNIECKSTYDTSKKKWLCLCRTLQPNRVLGRWESSRPIQTINLTDVAATIIKKMSTPHLTPSDSPLEIVSTALNLIPNALPHLPRHSSIMLSLLFTDITKMYESFQRACDSITDTRTRVYKEVKAILDTQLSGDEQISLLSHVPQILSILAAHLRTPPQEEDQSAHIRELITRLETFLQKQDTPTKESEYVRMMYTKYTPYLTHKKTERPEKLSDAINDAVRILSSHWDAILPRDRANLLDSFHALLTNPAIIELTYTYLPIAEYLTFPLLDADRASDFTLAISRQIKALPPHRCEVLASCKNIFNNLARHKHSQFSFNPLLEFAHTYNGIMPLLPDAVATNKAAFFRAVEAYSSRPLPPSSGTPKTWLHLIRTAIQIFITNPIKLEFNLYRHSLEFNPTVAEKIIPLLQPLVNDLVRCTEITSREAFTTNITDLLEHINHTITTNAELIESMLPPVMTAAWSAHPAQRLPELQKHCYSLIINTLYDAIKPQHDDTGPAVFLKLRKDALLQAIQDNQLQEYILTSITTLMSYLKPKITGGRNNGITLARFKQLNWFKQTTLQLFLSRVIKNSIPTASTAPPKVFTSSIIPIYNACVPLINHCIEIIEGNIQQLSTTSLEAVIQCIQDVLWYFG